MKLLFYKHERAPSTFPFHSVGLFKLLKPISGFKSIDHENNKFPLFDYPTFLSSLTNTRNDKLFLGSTASYYKIGKDIDEFPCLFLEFADLDLRNRKQLFEFIDKYGFLMNVKKIGDVELLCGLDFNSVNLLDNKVGEFSKNEDQSNFSLTGESFEFWVRFQLILRTMIRVWRFLINKKLNRISHATKKTFYETELFSFEDGKLFFIDKMNLVYGSTFNHEISKFYEDYDFIDKKYFKNLSQDIFSNKIELTDYMKNHKPSYNQSFIMSLDFIEYFAEEFLREQLNNALESFSSKTSLSGFVSFRSELAPDGLKISKSLRCSSLFEAIINQFIDTVTENKKFIRCLECQKWMTIGRKKAERKNYCSNQCRSKAYERRKKLFDSSETLELLSNLQPIDEIKTEVLDGLKSKGNRSVFEIFSNALGPNIKEKDLFKSILKNSFDNFNIEAQQESISDHLGITIEQSNKIMRHTHINSLMRFNYTPYWDWDWDQ